MRILRTENEIMRNWKGDLSKPLVTICCTTFNHESYIEDAIEGFLIQEADFPFEIVIHDDASTDRTGKIIKKYAEKYPILFKPVFQTENQYSKGRKALPLAISYARGEYIAICEGDDYWTDPSKLRVQIEEMGKYPGCNISCHPAIAKYMDGSKSDRVIQRHSKGNRLFDTDVVILGGGSFCVTASLLLKTKVFESMPNWFHTKVPVADFFLQIYGSLGGGMLYIDRTMAVRRENVPGSWSVRLEEGSPLDYLRHMETMEQCYVLLNKNFHGKYSHEINKRVSDLNLDLSQRYLRNGNYRAFRKYIERGWKLYPTFTITQRVLFIFRKRKMALKLLLAFIHFIVRIKRYTYITP